MKTLIKKYLPKRFFLKLIVIRDELKYFYLFLSSRNKITAFFSMLVNRVYVNEHYAFLKGACDYESKLRKNVSNLYFLRRNVHRIEKGLIMKPRRNVFALRFIHHTVHALSDACSEVYFTKSSEFDWAFQVLAQYFSLTASSDERYSKAETLFDDLSRDYSSALKEIPIRYENNLGVEFEVAFNKIMRQRKSVRWYDSKLIPRTFIDKALEMASLAPSSCNRQPYRYIIINEPSMASNVASIPAGTVGWATNIPCLAVLVADQSAFSNAANRHSIYVDSTLSVMPFVLSLETQGLSTCIINWADLPKKEKLMTNALDLKASEKVVLSISIGFSDSDQLVPFSKRKTINEISTYL